MVMASQDGTMAPASDFAARGRLGDCVVLEQDGCGCRRACSSVLRVAPRRMASSTVRLHLPKKLDGRHLQSLEGSACAGEVGSATQSLAGCTAPYDRTGARRQAYRFPLSARHRVRHGGHRDHRSAGGQGRCWASRRHPRVQTPGATEAVLLERDCRQRSPRACIPKRAWRRPSSGEGTKDPRLTRTGYLESGRSRSAGCS